MDLIHKKCVPCEGGTQPMTSAEMQPYLQSISDDWNLADDGMKIKREFVMKNFSDALKFINEVGKIAEEEDHHPDIHLVNYKHIIVDLSTHAIGGLSVNDFILAAKIDRLFSE